jgi:hypothetical protein
MADIIFFMFIGVVVGVVGFNWILNASIRQLQKKPTEDEIVDEALRLYKSLTIPLKIDKVNTTYYCYNNETNDFCCQGQDLEEIKQNFKARFPDHGSYILHDYLHMFPEAADMIVDDPTDRELKDKIKNKNLIK